MDYKELGQRIKAARLAARLTQEQLAEKIDLSSGHSSMMQKEKSSMPGMASPALLAFTLTLKPAEAVYNARLVKNA